MIPVQTAPGRCRLVHRCEAIEEVRDRSPQIGTTVQLGTLVQGWRAATR